MYYAREIIYFEAQLFGSNTENCEKTEQFALVHCFPKVKPWSTLLFLVSAQTNLFMSDSQTYTAATVKKQKKQPTSESPVANCI